MWRIENPSPYPAGKSWTRNIAGEHVWLVAVKATFRVGERGRVTTSDEQSEPLLAPEYTGALGRSSLRREAEILPAKPTTDVVVIGRAYAPRERPTRRIPVSLRVGPISKELLVHGPRVYRRGVTGAVVAGAPAETTGCELTYEQAYGGADLADPDPRNWAIDRRNPVGRGVARDQGALIGHPAHCVEYPSGVPALVGPAGLGPIAGHWSPRSELAGTYDDEWSRSRKPLLPLDYDPRHEQCSPADQRPAQHLVGGEPVALVNLTPEGLWRFDLPRLAVSFSTAFGRRRVEHTGELGTVILEPEARRLTMVWQTALVVAGPACDYLDQTTVKVYSQ